MHLTTGEGPLLGVVVGGALSLLGGRLVARVNSGAQHQRDLWQRRLALYEGVLLQADSWFALRTRLMRSTSKDVIVVELDNAQRQRMHIRLTMLGDQEVQTTFERCAQAHWSWAGAQSAFMDASRQEDQQGPVPSGHGPAKDDVARLKTMRKTAAAMAYDADADLRAAVQAAVGRGPGRYRRSRRMLRNLNRRVHGARRERKLPADERTRREQLRLE
jgi:hypothetical protein